MNDYFAYISKISDLRINIEKSLISIHFTDSIHNDSTVFIKPNFTYPFYKEGITTNPMVIQELLGLLKDRAGRVIVGESDGGNRSFTADAAFKGHGIPAICKETGLELVNLSMRDDTQLRNNDA